LKPNFLLIGAMKAGTTSLDQYLAQHPEIFVCPLKEPHYFSTQAIFDKGADWYRGLYADAADGQVIGEASTSYTRYPVSAEAPARMRAANPDMKLVYVLREPVSRVESECLQTMKYAANVAGLTHIPQTVDAMLDYLTGDGADLCTDPVIASEYVRQIEVFLEEFPRDQLCVILQEDLNAAPRETMTAVFAHLGVDAAFEVDVSTRLNDSASFVAGLKEQQSLSTLQRLPGYAIFKQLAPAGGKAMIKSWFSSRASDADYRLSPERRTILKAHFKEHNKRLAAFLERDLSHWD
ncbi:MAG: sulfotransferase, partial [Pseudomonadota bacterium]